MELETYRLVVKIDGKDHIGRTIYGTLEEATKRMEHLARVGYRREDMRVITDSELYK